MSVSEQHTDDFRSIGRQVAHDLKNHLVSIQGFPVLIQEQLPKGSEEWEMLGYISDSANIISELIGDYHLLLSIDTAWNDEEFCALSPILFGLADHAHFGDRFPEVEEELSIQLTPPVTIQMSHVFAEVLFHNLIATALRMARKEAKVQMFVFARPETSSIDCLFTIPLANPIPGTIDTFTKPFHLYREHQVPGSGLAMTVARALVNKAGGSLDLNAGDGQIRLRLKLPVATAPSA